MSTAPTLQTVASASDLHDLLEESNEIGRENGLCLPARDAGGIPFLASLAEEGGDSTFVEYITPNEVGRAWCQLPHCYSSSGMDLGWEPSYPVTVWANANSSEHGYEGRA